MLELFLEAYPLARRAAAVRSAGALRILNALGIDRDDFEQEIIVTVWRNLQRFDPLRASLRTFVETVIATKATSISRKAMAQKRIRKDSETLGIPSVHIMVTLERRVDVRQALRMLSRADQNVARLLLHYKPVEIASKLGSSRAAVYRSMQRIRAVLKLFGLEKY